MRFLIGFTICFLAVSGYGAKLDKSYTTDEASAIVLRQETKLYLKCVMKSHRKKPIKDKDEAKRRGSDSACRKHLDGIKAIVSDAHFQDQLHDAITIQAAKEKGADHE